MNDVTALIFDMDGTLALTYSVPNWLNKIENYDVSPYVEALPIPEFQEVCDLVSQFMALGIKIIITSWLSKNSNPEYDEKIRLAKLEWLEKWGFPYDKAHIIKYGTTKANCTRRLKGEQILIDDNEKVRKGWKLGRTIDANQSFINELTTILSEILDNRNEN